MTMTAETYHVPVLLRESIDGLDIKPDGVYADVTFGGGGHSREILRQLGKNGHLYSFDQDEDSEKNVPDPRPSPRPRAAAIRWASKSSTTSPTASPP